MLPEVAYVTKTAGSWSIMLKRVASISDPNKPWRPGTAIASTAAFFEVAVAYDAATVNNTSFLHDVKYLVELVR